MGMMKCDFCNRPAVVHETTVKSGEKKEVHLCEVHAHKAGVTIHHPLNQVLTQFVGTARSGDTLRKRCETCGLSFAQFRQTGTVGCPDCYAAFEAQLEPLIERAQNGGTHHIGKTPRRAGGSIDRKRQIQKYLKELDDAVASEQYERAAELRDQLQSLETNGGERG
jgi:protein arginine kinase activator